MEKKLIKHGNSVALIIDKALLKLLKIDETSVVTISITDNSLVITPTKKKTSKNKKSSDNITIAKRIMKKHNEIFKKLAKT